MHIPEPTVCSTPAVSYHTDQEIGPFVLERCRELGQGYQVWSARRAALSSKPIDLFLLEPDGFEASMRAAFLDRARAAAGVRHPYLLRVFGAQTVGAHTFAVMERDDYVSLAQMLVYGPCDWSEAVSISLGVALAVRAVHAQGLVHGSIGLRTIRLDPEGWVRVGGFGPNWVETTSVEVRQDVLAVARLSWSLLAGHNTVVDQIGAPPDANLLRAPEVWSVLSQVMDDPSDPNALSELCHWLELSPEGHLGASRMSKRVRPLYQEGLAAEVTQLMSMSSGERPGSASSPSAEMHPPPILSPPRRSTPTVLSWSSPSVIPVGLADGVVTEDDPLEVQVLDAFEPLPAPDEAEPLPTGEGLGRRLRLPRSDEIADAVRSVPTQRMPSSEPKPSEFPEGERLVVSLEVDGELRRAASNKRGPARAPSLEGALTTKLLRRESRWVTYFVFIVALMLGGVAAILTVVLLIR